MPAAVVVKSMTLIQQPSKDNVPIIFKKKPIASTQQIFITATFLQSHNFSLLGKEEP